MPFPLLDLIVCPACYGRLARPAMEPGDDALMCTVCGRLYAVQDGLPVLIPERARPQTTNG